MATKEFLRKLREKHGLGEYRKGRKAPAAKAAKKYGRVRARARPRRTLNTMAKRRSTRRAGGLMSGGMVGQALKGVGLASVAGVFVGENPIVRAAAGYVGGKIPGAVAAFGLAYMKTGGLTGIGIPATSTTYGTGGY